MKKLFTQKFAKEMAEEMAMKAAIKREKTAESKIMYILEEIAIALKKKGVKEFNGQHYKLEIT